MRNGWNWKYPLSYMYPAHTQLLAKCSSPSIGDRRATGCVQQFSMKKVFEGMFTIKQLSKSNLGHFQYKTIFKKHFWAFSVSNNFQGDISWPDAAGEAATLSGGSHWWFAITNCKLQVGMICISICKLKRKQEYQIIMNRVIESDLLLDRSSVLRLQNLVTLIFKKKWKFLWLWCLHNFLETLLIMAFSNNLGTLLIVALSVPDVEKVQAG